MLFREVYNKMLIAEHHINLPKFVIVMLTSRLVYCMIGFKMFPEQMG